MINITSNSLFFVIESVLSFLSLLTLNSCSVFVFLQILRKRVFILFDFWETNFAFVIFHKKTPEMFVHFFIPDTNC